MATRSTIMDTNSFRAEHGAALPEQTRALAARRERVLGASYRLFYRDPVHIVRGEGAYLWDDAGEQYLDVYNNVPSVGHAHPRVVEAISRQAALVNTHTRYLHTGVLDYAEDLLTTLPESIEQVMFMCTGSEANDLAIRVARAYTGGSGIIVSSEAYHGNTELTSGHSPALGQNQPLAPSVRLVPPPDDYRAPWREEGYASVGDWFAARVQSAIDDLISSGTGFAGLLIDSVFSSDGVLPGEPGMLKAAVGAVHRSGGVVISDEVQPGFGRTGDSFWGFGRHGVRPDIVTMGKPMGNGLPISAMAARSEVLEAFSTRIPYFNTFGGNPVSVAAAQAVLDTVRDEGLQERAQRVGTLLRTELTLLAEEFDVIGDVRGAGQFTGLELVSARDTREPAGALALDVIEGMRRRRVLSSVAGPSGNVLKLRPTLAFDEGDVGWLVSALRGALTEALAHR